MKTIDDLPIEILTHILSFTTPYIDIFVKLKLINSKWNEAVKHRLSRVKHLIQTFTPQYKGPPIRAETMFSITPVYSLFDDRDWDGEYIKYFIGFMEMLPGLQAVEMHYFYDLSIQNKIFSYFNSRPTIKALAIYLDSQWIYDFIEPMLEEAVKLKNITMLSIICEDGSEDEQCKKFIEYFFPTDHEFEQLWLADVTDVSFIFQKMTKIRKLYLEVDRHWHTDMLNHLCDLEIFGVRSHTIDILEYLSKVTSLSPKLTSIHVALDSKRKTEPMKNFKQFNQVENLVIEYKVIRKSLSYAEKILRMYPMVKNLSIKNLSVLSQEEILSIFQWMPNLSILHLVYYIDSKEVPWTVNVDNLVSAYNELHGRLIEIWAVEKSRYFDEHIFDSSGHNQPHILIEKFRNYTFKPLIFEHGFDFMKHIFFSYDYNQPHILLE